MRTRGMIWSSGAETLQRICFPGYGGRQSNMPLQQPVRQVTVPDEQDDYQIQRGKEGCLRRPKDDQYVLSTCNLSQEQSEWIGASVSQKALFLSDNPVLPESMNSPLAERIPIKQKVSQELCSDALPGTDVVNSSHQADAHAEPSHKKSKASKAMTQQDFYKMMQREVAELRDQLTSALISSVNALVEGQQKRISGFKPIKPVLREAPNINSKISNDFERVKVAEINSGRLNLCKQKPEQAKKVVLSYKKLLIPEGIITSYELSGNRYMATKILESKICISWPEMSNTGKHTNSDLDTKPAGIKKMEEKSVDQPSFASNIWEQQSDLLVPLIEKTCRDLIQKEMRALKGQLTGMIEDMQSEATVSDQSVDSGKINTEVSEREHSIKKEIIIKENKNYESLLEKANRSPQTKESIQGNGSRLSCFSKAGAVAYRELQKNPGKLAALQNKNNKKGTSVKESIMRRRKRAAAHNKIKELRDQLNAIVWGGSQSFSVGDEKKRVIDNKLVDAGLELYQENEIRAQELAYKDRSKAKWKAMKLLKNT